MKVQSEAGKKVPSCNQPDCRTVEGSGEALRKQGNDDHVRGKIYNEGRGTIDAGKGTTNPPYSKDTGLRTMPQGFTAGSGKPPSRVGD